MSFFFVNQSIIYKFKGHPKKTSNSLQLIEPTTKKGNVNKTNFPAIVSPTISESVTSMSHKVKRTFLFTHLNGSITIEAAIVLPLFVFCMVSIMYLINIIYIQTTLQMHLENMARTITSYSCITTGLDVTLTDDESSLVEKIIFDSAGAIAVETMFMTDEIKDFIDNTLIVDGSEGISFWGTSVTNTEQPLDICLSYKVRMPFIPSDSFSFDINQHCYFKAFNGRELYKNIFLRVNFVYVTKDGEVYHANKVCTYLGRFTSLRNLTELQKEKPGILPCTFCKHQTNLISRPTLGQSEYVYVTKELDVYHYVEACPSLQRNLIRLPLDEAAGAYTPCSRCVVYEN